MANQNSGQFGVVQGPAQRCRRILRGTAAIISGIVAAAALGCASTWAPSPVVESRFPYTVGAPDVLLISILPEPAIEAEVTVRPDGIITVPLIGEVPARDRTIPEIAADIEERIARFKRDPNVSVTLSRAASPEIVILGEVGRQGAFPLVKETRALEAIALVGGTTEFGWDSRIRVIRTVNGEVKILRVKLNKIFKGDLSTNLMLEPGDFVYVPPTIWARFGHAMNALLYPFSPVLGFARSIGANLVIP
jgi:polysaccharide export outer membrane protein